MKLVLILFLSAAGAAAGAPPELIYGAELMSAQEREAYRRDLAGAKKAPEQARVRERHRERIRERARQRGVELAEPDGIVRKKAAP